MIAGVDFGAPQWARDQRRKIIAVAARSTGWHSCRIDATRMNTRLLANDPPGWTAKDLVDELVARPARVVGFGGLGVELLGDLPPGISDDDIDGLVDRLIVVVEARKLGFGGGGGRDGKFEGFVTRMGRGSAIEDGCTALAAFLAGEDAIVHHEVGPPRDA